MNSAVNPQLASLVVVTCAPVNGELMNSDPRRLLSCVMVPRTPHPRTPDAAFLPIPSAYALPLNRRPSRLVPQWTAHDGSSTRCAGHKEDSRGTSQASVS